MQNTATIEMNNVNQNENAQIVSNALNSFKARFNLHAKARDLKELLPLNSVVNGCTHLKNRADEITANIKSENEFKNTNLISFKNGVYTTSLYLGKAVIYLGTDENGKAIQLQGEFDTPLEAVSMIRNYVEIVESEEPEFVQSMTKAIKTISGYKPSDRSLRRSKQQQS